MKSAHTRRSERPPPRILLAEDDAELRRLLAATLRKDGHAVVEAENGFAMVGALASQLIDDNGGAPVDLIISDVRMPGISGLSVLSGLRASGWGTPFIVITAFGGPDVQDRAIHEGATAVFDKPFDLDELRSVVFGLTGLPPRRDPELDFEADLEFGGEG